MIMNGVGAIGRVIPGFLADLYLGPLNVVIPAAAICTVLLLCWMAIQSSTALYVWAVFYGKSHIPFYVHTLKIPDNQFPL